MTNHNQAFARLLKAGISSIANGEGKTAPIIEEELGTQIGLAGHSIQRYKSGHLPPEPRSVRILAEACVRRGLLGREWLQRFLDAASYPKAAELVEQLCPSGPARQRPPRVYHNLPAPTYGQFVMRQQPFDEVIDGLLQRSSAVLIVGLGGSGKTSLAREIAARCLQDESDAPRFDAVVWVSDKDRLGTTNLSIVLDEIARTLDYPGFTQFEHDEKLYEVGQLLKRQRVLLVIDNFETITDGALLAWLLRLPEPSKALITSREYGREYRRGGWPVELRGMREAEAQALIGQRLRLLRIAQLVGDQSQLEPLLVATGGNPKAIEIALGLVKHERRPLQQVVDDLYAARGELFDDLFTRAWALLDEAARRVLLVMTFFPTSASGDALAATADVQGFAFDRAVERLIDLALLDAQQEDINSAARYVLHPLVRAFAGARLAERAEFEAGARERWVGWCMSLVKNDDKNRSDVRRMEVYDLEEETIYTVAKWAFQTRHDDIVINIVRGMRYYYNVRGFWNKRMMVNLMHANSAQRINNIPQEARGLIELVVVLSKQGYPGEAEKYFSRLNKSMQDAEIPSTTFFAYQYAIAIHFLAKDDVDNAQKILIDLMPFSKNLTGNKYILNRRWLAVCLYRQGDLQGAERLFEESLQDAKVGGHRRAVTGNLIRLAIIDIDRGKLDAASEKLIFCHTEISDTQDRRRLSEILPIYSRLHTLRNDLPAARAALAEAIDLFERLGMRRELAEARDELARLEAQITDGQSM